MGTLGTLGGTLVGASRMVDGAIRALFTASEQGVWYDPSDFSTMFQDDAGTTPVTAVGDPVGKILDKSGRGNHATQVTSTARPVLQQDANGRYYLAFDGTDDFLVTPSIDFTGTDKMSVFAGVRKLSDAAQGIVVELSANSTDLANVGSFELSAPSSAAGNDYQTYMRGTSGRSYLRPATFASPITNVVSCVYDLSAASLSTSMYPRINGNLEQDGGAYVAMGGSFGSYALHIGRRGGTTLPFNGRLYSLIVRGAFSDAAQIAAVEAYVNSKTAAY